MNIKPIFAALTTFVFAIAFAFSVQVDSASASKSFKYKVPYVLPQFVSETLTDTPDVNVIVEVQNLSPNYSADAVIQYSGQTLPIHIPGNDPTPVQKIFNPHGSEIQITNTSKSKSSKVQCRVMEEGRGAFN